MPAPTLVYRYLLLGLPALFLLTSGARLYRFLHERSDIWWTPAAMLVPLTESHDRVAIYVRGSELDDLVAAGQLRLVRNSATSVVSPADIGLRLNNWDRVRAERIPGLLISGVTVGAAAALLLVGLILTLVGRRAGVGSGTRNG
jgi:hypothetical protein